MPATPLTPLEEAPPKVTQKINFDEMMKTSLEDDFSSSESDYGDVVEDGLDALDDWGDVAETVGDDDDDNNDGDLLKSVSIMSSTNLGNTLSSIKKRREKSLEFERNKNRNDSVTSSGMTNEWLSCQAEDVRFCFHCIAHSYIIYQHSNTGTKRCTNLFEDTQIGGVSGNVVSCCGDIGCLGTHFCEIFELV